MTTQYKQIYRNGGTHFISRCTNCKTHYMIQQTAAARKLFANAPTVRTPHQGELIFEDIDQDTPKRAGQ